MLHGYIKFVHRCIKDQPEKCPIGMINVSFLIIQLLNEKNYAIKEIEQKKFTNSFFTFWQSELHHPGGG